MNDPQMTTPMNKAVKEYWLDHYTTEHPLCSLCANTGVIDTRSTAVSAAGVRSGRLNWCICPNGQAMRSSGTTPGRA